MVVLLAACSDEELNSEAKIVSSFRVVGISGATYNSSIEGNKITIKIAPHINATTELDSVVPIFFLSKGATVDPDPSIPQNFTQEGGVKYTISSQDGGEHKEYIVTYGDSDLLPHGEGFSFAEIGVSKLFHEMGYPGEQGNYDFADSKQYGDLNSYHAYCGDYIVMLSRQYVDSDPNSPYCVKVVDKTSLDDASSFNLGTIAVENLKMISSDYYGNCVGIVTDGTQTEVFYWKNPSDAPTSVGSIDVNLAPFADSSNNFQVAGDITSNAWISAYGTPRDASIGRHYRVKITAGKLASKHTIIETSYASNDCTGFQMISPYDDSDQPRYVVGDSKGAANKARSIGVYANTFDGLTTDVMPELWQNTLQPWWVGTGTTPKRMGSHAPIVSAMLINGKSYVVVLSGTAWRQAAAVLTSDLQTLAHENLNIAETVNRAWSFGGWVDWYWDKDKNEGNLSIWFGRYGMKTYKLSCYQ